MGTEKEPEVRQGHLAEPSYTLLLTSGLTLQPTRLEPSAWAHPGAGFREDGRRQAASTLTCSEARAPAKQHRHHKGRAGRSRGVLL